MPGLEDNLGLGKPRGSIGTQTPNNLINAGFEKNRIKFQMVGVELNKIQDQNVTIIRKVDEIQKELAERLGQTPPESPGETPPTKPIPSKFNVGDFLSSMKGFLTTGALVIAALAVSSEPMRLLGSFLSVFKKGKIDDFVKTILGKVTKGLNTVIINPTIKFMKGIVEGFVGQIKTVAGEGLENFKFFFTKTLFPWGKNLGITFLSTISKGIMNIPGISQIIKLAGGAGKFLGKVGGVVSDVKGKVFDFAKGVGVKAKALGTSALGVAGKALGIDDLMKMLKSGTILKKLGSTVMKSLGFIGKKIPLISILTSGGLFSKTYTNKISKGGSERDAFIAAFPHLTAGIGGTALGGLMSLVAPGLGTVLGAVAGDFAGEFIGEQIAPYVYDNLVAKSDFLSGTISTGASATSGVIDTGIGMVTGGNKTGTKPVVDNLKQSSSARFNQSDAGVASDVAGKERIAGTNIIVDVPPTPAPPQQRTFPMEKNLSLANSGDSTFGHNLWNLAFGKGML